MFAPEKFPPLNFPCRRSAPLKSAPEKFPPLKSPCFRFAPLKSAPEKSPPITVVRKKTASLRSARENIPLSRFESANDTRLSSRLLMSLPARPNRPKLMPCRSRRGNVSEGSPAFRTKLIIRSVAYIFFPGSKSRFFTSQ